MRVHIILVLTALILIGCGKSKDPTDMASIQFVLGKGFTKNNNGPAMVYFVNTGDTQNRHGLVLPGANTHANCGNPTDPPTCYENILQGTYDIYAVAFYNSSGSTDLDNGTATSTSSIVMCPTTITAHGNDSSPPYSFAGGTNTSLSINLTRSSCVTNTSTYGPTNGGSPDIIKPVYPIFCDSILDGALPTSCTCSSPCSTNYQSFKFHIEQYHGTGSQAGSGESQAFSSCYQVGTPGSSTTTTFAYPAGFAGANNPFRLVMKSFSDTSCATPYKAFILDRGLANVGITDYGLNSADASSTDQTANTLLILQ